MIRHSNFELRLFLVQLFALIAITFAAYYPVLKNGFVWDDDRYIENNVPLRTPGGLGKIWLKPLKAEPQYYPLTHTSFWIEYHLWGPKPWGYHLDNILLHLGSAILLWRLLARLNVPGAFVAASVFAVHPLQVESVAWATERKNVLSGLLYFLALWTYLHTRWGRRICKSEDSGKTGIGWYVLSLVLFAAALLSKSVASTLPAAILLLCWWRKGKIRAADVWPLVPMFLAGAAMGCLTGWMEKHVVGAIGPDFDFLTPLDRCCIAGRAIWFYLAKLIWPTKLSFIYPRWRIDPGQQPWLLLFPVSAIAAVLACWLLRRRIGRGPVTAMLFFIGTLVPALGFVNVFPMRYSYVADHFQYIACIGPIALIVGILSTGCTSGAARVLAGVVIIAMCVASNLRSRVYVDRRTLWADTLAINPDSPMAHNNYGVALMHDGDLAAAKAQFHQAMALRRDAADWVGLGQCFAIEGNYSDARDMYLKALDATPPSPEPVFQRLRAGREFQLGTAYQGLASQANANSTLARQYVREAADAYRKAIEIFPDYEDPRLNLAMLLADNGQFQQAIEQCREVLRADPESVGGHKNLAAVFYMQGQLDPALAEYRRVLEIDSDNADAMASIGGILAQKGQMPEAITMLQKALKIDPNNAIAKRNLLAAIKQQSR
ncbi:MAG TPA: tetratricopeptide repeat protein [Tepidisphaeraceae bacterium]|nr:tetratricopeptide repeat protein [Tepidisphaeraceae bacterium]